MALIECAECGKEMSVDAAACPECGKPNFDAELATKKSKRNGGCFLFFLGLGVCLIFPIVGIPLLVVGIVVAILNDC